MVGTVHRAGHIHIVRPCPLPYINRLAALEMLAATAIDDANDKGGDSGEIEVAVEVDPMQSRQRQPRQSEPKTIRAALGDVLDLQQASVCAVRFL